MVTATSRGGEPRVSRQRAASSIRAVESGPPETARRRPGSGARSANRALASPAKTGKALTAGSFLFAFGALFNIGGGARKLASHFAEGGAGGLLFAQRRQGFAQSQQRIGAFGRGFVFRGYGQEQFRRV